MAKPLPWTKANRAPALNRETGSRLRFLQLFNSHFFFRIFLTRVGFKIAEEWKGTETANKKFRQQV
jgi:hypothetical protein